MTNEDPAQDCVLYFHVRQIDCLTHPAARDDRFARHPTCVIGREERHHVRNVVRLTDATERRLRDHRACEIAADDAARSRAFRDRIHADFARAKFFGERRVKLKIVRRSRLSHTSQLN